MPSERRRIREGFGASKGRKAIYMKVKKDRCLVNKCLLDPAETTDTERNFNR